MSLQINHQNINNYYFKWILMYKIKPKQLKQKLKSKRLIRRSGLRNMDKWETKLSKEKNLLTKKKMMFKILIYNKKL